MSKNYLSNAYTNVYICPEDLLQLSFPPPLHPSDHNTLIGFQLYLPMGYVDISPFFCWMIETVSDLSNQILAASVNAVPHLISALIDTPPDP